MSTNFILCHRGWRDAFIPGTEPSRYANRPSQSLGSIAHKPIKKVVVFVALGDERLGVLDILASANQPERVRRTLICEKLKHASMAFT